MPGLRRVLVSVLGTVCYAAAAVVVLPAVGVSASPEPTTEPYRFLSAPDFMNTDVGDVTGSPYYRQGQPNSINDSYRIALAHVMNTWTAEAPNDVLVAGDLVQGHWGLDTARTGTFGPLRTDHERRAAVRLAADTYLTQWRALFTEHGLQVHPAVGDHDIGDNPWGTSGAWTEFKLENLHVWKNAFARNVIRPNNYTSFPKSSTNAAGTAYSLRLAPEVLLVTVNVFKRIDDNVIAKLDREQLAWLDRVLTTAEIEGVDWIIVQGHTPVLGPVPQAYSSGLMYEGRKSSDFWQVMASHKVDVYLCGEVHEVSRRRASGIVQIAHGGIFPGTTSYLVGDITDDHLVLRAFKFQYSADRTLMLWQTDTQKERAATIEYGAPYPVGEMTLRSDNLIVSSSGQLDGL